MSPRQTAEYGRAPASRIQTAYRHFDPLWHAADITIDTATSVGGPDSEENRKGGLHSISAMKGESRRAPIPARPPGLKTDGWWFGW